MVGLPSIMTRATRINSTQIWYTCPICRTLDVPSKVIEHVTNNSGISLDNRIALSKPDINCKLRSITMLNIQITSDTVRLIPLE